MKILITVTLLFLNLSAFSGGTSEEVRLISLTEIKQHEHTLMYKSVASGEIYTIGLSYSRLNYFFKARFLTQEKYDVSISLLTQQLIQGKIVRFGWFGGGPCPIDEDKNIYRSDALEVYNESYSDKESNVVYAFCEYS